MSKPVCSESTDLTKQFCFQAVAQLKTSTTRRVAHLVIITAFVQFGLWAFCYCRMTPASEPHILLIAHEPLASALRACALHVFSDCANYVHALDVPDSEPPESTLERAWKLLEQHQAGAALLLTDILGATPANVSHRLLDGTQTTKLLVGVNLPMLLRAICYRHETLEVWAERALAGGQQGMSLAARSTAPQHQNSRNQHYGHQRNHHQQ